MMLLSHHVPYLTYADWFELVTFITTVLGVVSAHFVWQESRRHRYAAQTEGQWIIANAAIQRTALMVWIQLWLMGGAIFSLFYPPPGDGQIFGVQAQITRVSIIAASLVGVRKSICEKHSREELWRYFDRRRSPDKDGIQARKDLHERKGPKRKGEV